MKSGNQKNHAIIPSLVLLPLILVFLNACSSSGNSAEESGRWVSIVIGILLLMALVGLAIYLWRAGKLSSWYAAGTKTARLKSQDVRLKGELRGLERDKSSLLDELGEKAWAARVSDQSYESDYNQLITIQGQIDGAGDYRRTLEEKKTELTQQRQEVVERFGQQIDALVDQQAQVERSLNDASNRVRTLEADLDATAQEKTRFQRDVKDTRSRIIELERSDDPTKADQLSQLNSRLSSLTTSLLDATNAEPDLAAQLPGLQNQALALSTELNNLQNQTQALEGDRKTELFPLDDQLEAIEKQLKNNNNEIKAFEEQLRPLVRAIGAQVEAARPLSPELTELYQKLDVISGKVDYKQQARDDVSTNLGEVDKTASLSFYVFVLVGVLILVLAILLLTGVI